MRCVGEDIKTEVRAVLSSNRDVSEILAEAMTFLKNKRETVSEVREVFDRLDAALRCLEDTAKEERVEARRRYDHELAASLKEMVEKVSEAKAQAARLSFLWDSL